MAMVRWGFCNFTTTPANLSQVEINGGGGLACGAGCEEAAARQPTLWRFRYIGAAATLGPQVSVFSSSGVSQHDAAMAGFRLDDNNGDALSVQSTTIAAPRIDGFRFF